jgi:hypothetical protein
MLGNPFKGVLEVIYNTIFSLSVVTVFYQGTARLVDVTSAEEGGKKARLSL